MSRFSTSDIEPMLIVSCASSCEWMCVLVLECLSAYSVAILALASQGVSLRTKSQCSDCQSRTLEGQSCITGRSKYRNLSWHTSLRRSCPAILSCIRGCRASEILGICSPTAEKNIRASCAIPCCEPVLVSFVITLSPKYKSKHRSASSTKILN